MAKYFKNPRALYNAKPGAAPGTLIVPENFSEPKINLIGYDNDKAEQVKDIKIEEIEAFLKKWPQSWVDVRGLGSEKVLQELIRIFKIHNLAMEDVLHLYQRPKYEEYDDHLFLVLRMVINEPGFDSKLKSEQISWVVGKSYVITFQESKYDCLDPLRERLLKDKSRARLSDTKYLAYAILDIIVDNYFPAVESYGDKLIELEERINKSSDHEFLLSLQGYKKDLLELRRYVWPVREMINGILRDNASIVSKDTGPYLRDCLDHVVRLMEFIETYRETTLDLIEVYNSVQASRMNEIIKVLTVISTIFMPLTFLVGVYGMNFSPTTSPWNMPELNWKYGYLFVWSLILALAFLMWYFFKKRKWI